jgi:hypothetical protein
MNLLLFVEPGSSLSSSETFLVSLGLCLGAFILAALMGLGRK